MLLMFKPGMEAMVAREEMAEIVRAVVLPAMGEMAEQEEMVVMLARKQLLPIANTGTILTDVVVAYIGILILDQLIAIVHIVFLMLLRLLMLKLETEAMVVQEEMAEIARAVVLPEMEEMVEQEEMAVMLARKVFLRCTRTGALPIIVFIHLTNLMLMLLMFKPGMEAMVAREEMAEIVRAVVLPVMEEMVEQEEMVVMLAPKIMFQ